jgi:hypothetical protein
MFRAIRNLMAAEAAGFENMTSPSQDAAFRDTQRTLYQDSLPNMFYVKSQAEKDALKGIDSALSVANPLTRTVEAPSYSVYNAATPTELSPDVISKMSACESATLDSLITGQNAAQTLRCGWLYKPGPSGALINRGVLGTSQGPIFGSTQAQGSAEGATYYWDMYKAQKDVAGDLCRSLTSCSAVQDSRYVGKCAFDPVSGRGVPIFENGTVMFPNEPTLSANPATLIRSRDACPPPPAPGTPAYEYQQSQGRDICAQLPNGTFSRDCMLQQVKAGGCTVDGSLALALSEASNLNDYGAELRKKKAYDIYQKRAQFPLEAGALKDGSIALNVALDNFKALSGEARKTTLNGLQAAARDLCLESGVLDRFDFCSELISTTPPPYSLECLRKEWIRLGGLPTGRLYPTEQNIGDWNALPRWMDVTKKINELRDNAQKSRYEGFNGGKLKENFDNTGALMQLASSHVPKSKHRRFAGLFEGFDDDGQQSQSQALLDFYGIQRQAVKVAPMPFIAGVEVYWFNLSNNTFLGRSLSYDAPKIDTASTIPIVNAADNVQMVMITNLRPPEDMSIRVGAISNDGIILTLNKTYQRTAENTLRDTSDEFARYKDQTATEQTNDACWKLVRGGPNLMVADWYERVGNARFELFYRDCADNNTSAKKKFPSHFFSLTKEPEAPFLDFHYKDGRILERRLSALFDVRATGGANQDPVRGAVRLARNGALTFPTPVSVNSWRSLTVRFVCYTLPLDRQVFLTYGSLFQIYMEKGKTYAKITSPNLTQTREWATDLVSGEVYILYVNMRSSFQGGAPDILSIGLMPQSFYATGQNPPLIQARTPRGLPLYNMSDSHTLVLGSTDPVSTDFGIQAVRFYDYELNGADLKRDAEDKWLGL